MKRDWNLLRQMLTDVEDDNDLFARIPPEPQCERSRPVDIYLTEYNDWLRACEYVSGHLKLLLDGGLIEGVTVSWGMDGHISFGVAPKARLTMEGHELLDTLRSPTLWEQIKAMAQEKKLELTFTVIKALSVAAIKRLLK